MFTANALIEPSPAELVRIRKRLYGQGLCSEKDLFDAVDKYIESKPKRLHLTRAEVLRKASVVQQGNRYG